MKVTAMLVTVILAIGFQLVLARLAIGGRWPFDFVLVGVLYAALEWGPTAGIVTGSLGGLVQDALSGGTLGVDGLAKTLVGFAAGVVGGQFVVTKTAPRLLLAGAATIAHRIALLCLHAVIDQRWPGVPWLSILSETGLNVLAAFVVFQMVEILPGAMERRRTGRRSRFARREW